MDWFSKEEITLKEKRDSSIKTEAGAGIKENSLWTEILGLFVSLKGEIRFASSREQKIVEYRFSRIKDLINIANKIIDNCNQKMQAAKQCQWLVIGENFDKTGVSSKAN